MAAEPSPSPESTASNGQGTGGDAKKDGGYTPPTTITEKELAQRDYQAEHDSGSHVYAPAEDKPIENGKYSNIPFSVVC